MRVHRRDRFYYKSVFGTLEISVMICLFFGMVCAFIASTSWAQQADWLSQLCRNETTDEYVTTSIECSQNAIRNPYRSLSAKTVKTATIAIFLFCLGIILIIFLIHIFVALRKRKSWKANAKIIAIIFIPLLLLILSVSTVAVFWEIKLLTLFNTLYTSNSYQSTPNGSRKAQTGAASAAAALGFLAACLLLIDIICRLLSIGSLRKRHRRRKIRVNVIS